jgi:hypothetical protein
MQRTVSGSPGEPKGYQQITAPDTATSLTVPAGARSAVLKPTTQAIRIRDDGTDPTTTIGYPVAVGEEFEYHGRLEKVRVISQVAGAVVNVLYYA